ncbi:MAG: hypothetical protein HDT21_11715 [Ruminococcus sp.]|nr:hypothetical protein [Ruminococcus sp.]
MFAPPRNAIAFLTSCSVSEDMRLRARGRSFALCGARPKGSALWTSASWAQLDQLMSAATPPKCLLQVRGALNQNLSRKMRGFSQTVTLLCQFPFLSNFVG